MFSVVLPEKHRAIETYVPVKGGVMLSPTDDVCDWLVGNGQSLVSIEPGGGRHPMTSAYTPRTLVFNFSSQADALLFKLTWGGV